MGATATHGAATATGDRISLRFLSTLKVNDLREARALADAIEVPRHARMPAPQISDGNRLRRPTRAVATLRAHGISTLSALTAKPKVGDS